MLRKLTIQNFVHFQEEQIFIFQEGSYFFIGGNRSGKSCTFEAIRRCMSTSKNFFMSTRHDKAGPSYVICEYASNSDTDKHCTTIYSCVVSVPNENTINVKIVIVKPEEKTKEGKIFVDLVKKNSHDYPVNIMFPVEDARYGVSVERLLGTQISIESLKEFVFDNIIKTEFYQSFISETEQRENVAETHCEKYLRQTIDKEVVITEPMRSVSVAQWSNSPKFDIYSRAPKGDDRFANAMRFNSDIITWYLDNQTISVEERNTVDDVFNVLTENSRLRFENRDDVLQVIDNGNVVTLEKAPEGLLEAQICAILFSVRQFKTICLEEPGKGMHVQMIERLRELALRRGQNKTIIMITHVPAFLYTWNIERIFFFRRSSDLKDRPLFKAIHGNDLLPKNEYRSRRISADYSLLTMFFATRVLLVEGRSDERFISAVKSTLLDDRELANTVLQSARSDLNVDALYRFLSSLQVLPLNGQRNKLRFERMCTALGLERYFMLDYDAILDSKRSTSVSKFFREFDLEYLEGDFRQDGVTVLEGKGMFVWGKPPPGSGNPNQMGGTIEDALIILINRDGEELKNLFTVNHGVLNWEYRKKNDKKLFEDRDLTDDNVADIAHGVIRSCLRHLDCDVFRLIKFLVRCPIRQTVEMTPSVIYKRS